MLRLLFIAAVLMSAVDSQDPVRRIEERLLAPCCWREDLAVHLSPEAEAMRGEIRQLVRSGKTEAEIVDLFVARYGERILREPRGRVSTWLTIVPLLVVVAGALLVAAYIARSRRQRPAATPAVTPLPLPDVEEYWR